MTSTLTEPSRTDDAPPPSKVRGWPRWLKLVLAVVFVAVMAGAVARELVVGSHQPFRPGSGFYGVEIEGVPDREIKRVDTHGTYPEPDEVLTLPFVEGRTVRILFPLYNRGPWDVTLTRVELGPRAPEFATLLQPDQVRLAPGQDDLYQREALPFEPSVIRTEENRLLVLEYTYVCQRGEPGSMQGRDHIDLRFELFGKTEWQRFPLPFRLMLTYPPRGSCTPLSR